MKWEHVQEPSTTLGTETMRMELSGLPERSKEVVGLNLMMVGGNSWAFRIVNSGCNVL